jgi:hypothetical protein
MGNFRFDTFPPWLSFEAQDDPLRLRVSASQPNGLGLTPFAYGAASGSGSETVGLANWRPPGTQAVPQSQPRPWWLFGDESDPNTPWLHVRPPDGPPGFHVAPDGTLGSGPAGNRTALSLDQQVSNVGPVSPFVGGPFAQHAWPLTDQPADTQTGWSRPPGRDEGPDGGSGPRWPWLRAEPTEEPPGVGLKPSGSIAPGQTGDGGALGLDRLAPNVGPTVPFVGGPFAQQTWPLTQPSLEAQPWWSRQPGQGEELESRSDLHWPWLRAEPTEESPDSGGNPDGSGDQSKPDEFNPLSFAYQPFDQMPPENFVTEGTGQPQVDAAATPLNPSQQPSGVDGPTAGSMALPAASAVAGAEGSARRWPRWRPSLGASHRLRRGPLPVRQRPCRFWSRRQTARARLSSSATVCGRALVLARVQSRSSGARTTVSSEQALPHAGRPCRLMPNCAWKRAGRPVF